ncbi:NAC domain-containing protein 1-like [Lycium ferocissimum]|uniref:NAC domain-containing protein 1-like n=1 Tax=Lycium ferocissimum TaxID=112874 RepID=UPI002815EF8D|nr:NAC domain-containing protein 1-like [Lycium ferocissimum]
MDLDELAQGFRPTDLELFTFLLRFIAKEPLCDDGFITELDVYKQEPWESYGHGRHCGGQDNEDTSIYRYFITPLKKKKGRFCRTVGKNIGTWKQRDRGNDVIMKGSINGRKNGLCYEYSKCRPNDQNDGKWLMTEYVFCDTLLRKFKNSEFKDYVICAIRKKSKKKSSNGTQSRNLTAFSNVMREINLPKEKDRLAENTGDTILDKYQTQNQPTPLQEGCIFGVNEDHIAYLELEAKVERLTIVGESAMRNNQVQTQEEDMLDDVTMRIDWLQLG